MLAIVDKRIPGEAKINLSKYYDIVELETKGVTFDYLSGHPDIFFCKVNNHLIYASNTPKNFIDELKQHNITLHRGNLPVTDEYPGCAHYNAVVTKGIIIHNSNVTDKAIHESNKDAEIIHVNQGLTRCSLLAITQDHFITSDNGIYKILSSLKKNVLSVSDKDIILTGLPNGLFGGTCGLINGKLFLLGSLKHYSDSEKLKNFLTKLEIEIVELYDGPLFDGGSILFV